jgi:ABC-type glycerol-3-phosphate transport system permease component
MVDGDSRMTAFRRLVVQRHLVRGLTMGAVK